MAAVEFKSIVLNHTICAVQFVRLLNSIVKRLRSNFCFLSCIFCYLLLLFFVLNHLSERITTIFCAFDAIQLKVDYLFCCSIY